MDKQAAQDDRSERAKGEEKKFPCQHCEHLKTCHMTKKGPLRGLLRDFKSVANKIEVMGGGLWLSFKRHLRFLKESGFVNEQDKLSPDGQWASKLRLDQPLLIAEAIRKGSLENTTPEGLAGGLAPFVWDRVQEVELSYGKTEHLSEIESIFSRVVSDIEQIRYQKSKRGFESPPIMFWPAAAIYLWAKDVEWERLLDIAPIDDGDMASLIMRTADHLRQVNSLNKTHPDLASKAEEAIELIMREPVYG
jgi:superfamily II RNA helicase